MKLLGVLAILYCLFLHYRLTKLRRTLNGHWREHCKSMHAAFGEDFDAVIEAEKREG